MSPYTLNTEITDRQNSLLTKWQAKILHWYWADRISQKR